MYIKVLTLSLATLMVSGCSTRGVKKHHTTASTTLNTTQTHHTTSATQGSKKVPATMRPYSVFGKRYYPTKVRVGETFYGISSWYGPDFDGKMTSSGEIYDMHALTAAHKTLPMQTKVRVTNRANGKSVIVRINDRGPFVGERIIDLSNKAAHKIDMVKKGTANVKLEVLSVNDNVRATSTAVKRPVTMNYKSYAIQIGSFSKIEGAMRVQEQYDGYKGHSSVIKDSETEGKRLFKVLLKGFATENEAREFKNGSPFQNAFIVGEN